MRVSLLIADSDGSLAAVFRKSLPTCYEVDTAQGGVECLAKLRNWAPDVLLLADSLPWGGADGVLDHMRRDPCLRYVPVVLISDEVQAEAFARLLPPVVDLRPVVDRLARPFPLILLLNAIRAAAFPLADGALNHVNHCAGGGR